MKKLFSFLLPIFVIALAVTIISCGDDTKTTPPPPANANLFAFLREAGGTGPIRAADMKGTPRIPQRRPIHGVGLVPWTNAIDNGTDSVILMNNDGTGETVAVNQGGWFYSIQLSGDGTKGAFTAESTSSDGTFQQIFLATAAGNNTYNVTQLTADAEDHYQVQLSLDGSKVVFVKYNDTVGVDQAYVMSSTGGTETVIPTPDTVNVLSPSFTPDGKTIVFEDCWMETINIVNVDGTGMQVLNDPADTGADLDDMPGVSPDGKYVIFQQDENVFVMDITGQNVKQLTTDGESVDPMFVNDRIVFLSYRDGATGTEVYSMKPDGTDQKRLTNNSVYEWFQDYDWH